MYLSSRLLEIQEHEVKALLTGFYLYEQDMDELGQIFDLGFINLQKILFGEVEHLRPVFDEFMEQFEAHMEWKDYIKCGIEPKEK